jgi:glutathione synthase/RimK-type ligase-like ATP-grasp enzyme
MWHFHHANSHDVLFSKQLIYSLQTSGKVMFPDINTCWYFDDKVAQKYLMESIGAPLVPTYTFYDKKTALDWIESVSFPKVFKLRHGAGSLNVQLAKTKHEAIALVKRSFGKGFPQYRPVSSLRERWTKFRMGQSGIKDVAKGLLRFGYTTDFNRVVNSERGYVYFQDYIPGKKFDLRVIVIGNKAFGVKRNNRPNDFRASGSGLIEYGKEHFSDELIKQSFSLAKAIKSKALSIDYVFDEKPMIVEVNFGYSSEAYEPCRGYWDEHLAWHEGAFNPQHWMVDGVIQEINQKKPAAVKV